MKSGAASPSPLSGSLGGYLPKTDSYLPSSPPGGGTGGSTPDAPDRPFEQMGKSSLSLYGPAGYYAYDPDSGQKDQSLVQGEAFKGVPVLEQAAQLVGGVANIPAYAISLPERFKSARVWEENAGTAERRYWEALVANNAISQEVAEAQFRRELFEEQHRGDKGIYKGLFAPTGDYSLGGQALAGLSNAFALPQRPWIRATGGNVGTFLGSLSRGDFRSPAEQRLESFRNATDAELNYGAGDIGHPELIDIRNRLKRGEINDDEAFDELIVAGFGVSNPTDLLPSIFNELGSDPTNLLGLGSGTIATMGTKAALSGSKAFAREVGEQGLRAFVRDLSVKGIVASEHNLIMHALKDPAMLAVAEKGLRANTNKFVQFMLLDAPAITRVGHAVNEALGPLSLFGRDSLGKATTEQFSRKLGSGTINGFGASNYRAVVANATKDLGDDVAEIMQDGFDRGAMQIGLQVGNEQNIRHIRVTQSLDGIGNDATAAAMGSASRLGGDIARRAQDRVERIRHRIVPTARGPEGVAAALRDARERATNQVVSMARGKVDRTRAEAFVGKLSEDQLSLIDFMHYGKVTEDFIAARNAAVAEGVLEEAPRTTFIGPRQLTRPALENLRKAMNKGQTGVVRGIIEKYDDLYRIYDLELADDELMRQLRETYDQLVTHAPQVLTDIASLPKSLQEFLRKYESMGYHVGLSPDADTLARPLMDKSGRIVGVNPWVDLVDGKTARQSINQLRVIQRGLFNNISGSSVIREAEHRFIRMGATRFGLPEQQLRGVFSTIMREASNRRVTVRGLHPHEMYQIALDARMPKQLRARMTERDLAEMVLEAHEGSLSKVGLSQKFTGKMKTNAIVYGGTNALGILAEKLYPALRFTLNPFFQLQELIETPFFMLLRGRVPMNDFRRVWTAQGRAELNDEIDKTMWVMGLIERKGSFYAQDMMEMSMLTLHGNRAINAQVRRNGILERFGKVIPNVARMKEWGVARSFQYEQGRALAGALKSASPDSWDNFARWMSYRSGQKNDLDAITNFVYDTVAKADPESAYAQFGYQALKPAHLGAQNKISTGLIRGLVYGEKEGKAVKWKTLLDEIEKGTRSAEEVSDALKRIGADPIYIQRAVDLVTMPRPEVFWKKFLTLGRTQEEIDAMRANVQALARLRGVSEHEQITSMYAAAPASLSHLGEVKSRKLFQAIADSFIARGMHVPDADDPALARLADVGAKHLPDLPEPTAGVKVKDLTPAQKKRRDYEVATERMLNDATGTVGRPPSLTGRGVTAEQGRAIQAAYDAGDVELGQRLQREATEAPGAIPGFGVPPTEGAFPSRYVTATRDGTTPIHRLGPVEGQQWWDMLHAVMDQDTLVEKADWYIDMRRGFLALADGDEEEAARLIVLFGISQLNTSPVDGMRFIHRALAAHKRGEPLPIDKKFSGLNSAAVKQLLEETQLTEAGMGQKLIDFVDSLLGRKTRTAGPTGPDPMNPWGPAAADIWAKRDLGFLDQKMATHLGRLYGGKAVWDDAIGFTVTTKAGDTFVIPKEKVTGGVPSDTEYAYIVQFYNDRAREANQRRFLDRDNWSAAEMQALGWFRAKFAMGDRTGSPLDAFHKNVHSVHWEAAPGPNSRYADVFPGTVADQEGLPEDVLRAITKDVAAFVQQEAQSLIGVQVIARFDGVGVWQGGINPNAAFEVLGTPEDAQAFARVIAYLSQQEGVPVSRLVPKGKAKAAEGRFHAIDWTPANDGLATYAEAEAVLRRLATEHPAVRDGGGSIVRYDDGSYGVRAIWFDDDSLKAFKAAFPDDTLGDVDGFVGERVVIESSYHENDYAKFPLGEGHLAWLKENGYASVADKLAGAGRDRAALYYERAYRKHYANGLDRWRAERATDDGWAERAGPLLDDLDVAYGRSAALDATAGPDVLGRAADAAARGDALFQRYPRGTLGAIAFDGDTNRARVYLNARNTNRDTLLHEESHRFAEQALDPSGRAAILDAYNAEIGKASRRKPKSGAAGVPARTTTWTEDVHEWFAKQYIEWVRTGDSPAKHLDPIFGFYSKYLTTTTAKAKMSPEVRAILNEVTSRKVTRASGANEDEVALMNVMIGEADRSARNARDLIHFRTNRSWVERSLNHPYFGMYPLSYMWGKVLPELVEFLVFRPFGVPAPLVAYNTVGDIYRGVMLQQENDPELRAYLQDNEPAMRGLAMLVPGVPWDLPVNSPLWLRRVSEAVATQNKRVLEGATNPDGTPAQIDLSKIDVPRIIGEVAGYALNPVRGVENLADSATAVQQGIGIAAASVTGQPLPGSVPDPRTQQPPALTTETPATPAPPAPPPATGPLAAPLVAAEQSLTEALTP